MDDDILSTPKAGKEGDAASDPCDSAVFIVDDDAFAREGLSRLLSSMGMRVLAFASPAEFLAATLPDLPSCLILDVRLPGLSGLDFHDEMTRSRADIPVIFLTGYADIAMTVRALKSGAVDFLEKPFRDQQLLDAVNAAVVEARRRRGTIGDLTALRAKAGMLSSRERDVMRLVTRGLMNKQVAAELGVSEITVKVHRANLMRKLEIRTLADLVRMAQQFDEF